MKKLKTKVKNPTKAQLNEKFKINATFDEALKVLFTKPKKKG